MGIYEILYRIYKVFLNIFLKENTLNHVNNFDLNRLPFNPGFVDNLSLEETKYSDIIDEANLAFKYNMDMFQELEGNLITTIGKLLFSFLTRKSRSGSTESS